MVGCAVARELARWPWRVALLEAADDVGDGTSKANTAILHTGFDATPGTLESRLVARGFDLLSAYAARSGIPVEPVGALLVAWDPEQLAALPGLAEKAAKNGYQRTRLVEVDELYAAEPHLGAGALGALEVPDESVICPWTTTLAFAVEAVGLGRRAAPGDPVAGRRARRHRGTPARDHERRDPRDVPGQRRGAGQRRGGPDARSPRLHGHAAPRPARRLRQAGTEAGLAHPAPGADRPREGRAGGAHRLRQRPARAYGRGPRRQDRHRIDGRRSGRVA